LIVSCLGAVTKVGCFRLALRLPFDGSRDAGFWLCMMGELQEQCVDGKEIETSDQHQERKDPFVPRPQSFRWGRRSRNRCRCFPSRGTKKRRWQPLSETTTTPMIPMAMYRATNLLMESVMSSLMGVSTTCLLVPAY